MKPRAQPFITEPLQLSLKVLTLNNFFVILPPLYELVLKIERHDLRGGKLLNLLHKRLHCGVPELQACIQRLLWHDHQVLYNQRVSWMVYGVLQDRHGEFFIRKGKTKRLLIQEDRDVEYGSFIPDTSDKLARLSADDKSSRDWHFGFHIFLVFLAVSCIVRWFHLLPLDNENRPSRSARKPPPLG
ncbi:hypothetical protein GQ457_01G000060 [Hibiscus cannabinus]